MGGKVGVIKGPPRKSSPIMPYFTRRQQGVILLLGAVLLLVYAWRAHFWRPFPPPDTSPRHLIFIEMAGEVARPGVFPFPSSPTLPQLWELSGAPGTPPPGGPSLASGTKVVVEKDGKFKLASMSGAQLLTLGLRIDLNQASAADLEALPGIGPALAKRILDYRLAHGPFKNMAELEQVSGIGPSNLEKLKPYLAWGSGDAETPASKDAAPGAGKPRKTALEEGPQAEGKSRPGPKKPPAGPMDPNLASLKDLETLPGIGPVLAQRIVAYRQQHGPFKKVTDLSKVSGIGPKKLEKMKPYLAIND